MVVAYLKNRTNVTDNLNQKWVKNYSSNSHKTAISLPPNIYVQSSLEGCVVKMIQAMRLGVYCYFRVYLQFVIFYIKGLRLLIRSSILPD